MIHAVAAGNRHLYRAQLRQLLRRGNGRRGRSAPGNTAGGGWDDRRSACLLALDGAGRVEAGLCIRPEGPSAARPGVWRLTGIFTPRPGRERRGPLGRRWREVALAGLEYAAARGAGRLAGTVGARLYPLLSDACPGELRISGPPMAHEGETLIGVWVEITKALLEDGRGSLGEPAGLRLFYEVEDEDLAGLGSLAAVERAVDRARRYAAAPDPTAGQGAARADALYARHDAALAGGPRLRNLLHEERAFARPKLAS